MIRNIYGRMIVSLAHYHYVRRELQILRVSH
jgi:hypothetical protein